MLKLRFLRLDARLSQTELGRQVGVTASLIGLIESGKLSPSEPLLAKLAEALGEQTPSALMKEVKPNVE